MDEKMFWDILKNLDWEHEGDDDLVLEPVIDRLSQLSDDEIFSFDDIMAKLLYAIDGQSWAKDIADDSGYFSDDMFLYNRCVAIVNGEEYYNDIKLKKQKLDGDLEFEAMLYVPGTAWAKKHGMDYDNYPHTTEYSYETGSNEIQWKE